jgi:hypothetical protein
VDISRQRKERSGGDPIQEVEQQDPKSESSGKSLTAASNHAVETCDGMTGLQKAAYHPSRFPFVCSLLYWFLAVCITYHEVSWFNSSFSFALPISVGGV